MILTRFIWLRKGSSGRPLWMQQWTSRFHKMQGFSWLAEQLLVLRSYMYCNTDKELNNNPGKQGRLRTY